MQCRTKQRRSCFSAFVTGALLVVGCLSLGGVRCSAAFAQSSRQPKSTVRIGVFSLFHTGELRVRPAKDSSLALDFGSKELNLSGEDEAIVIASGGQILVRMRSESGSAVGALSPAALSPSLHASAPSYRGGNSGFWLEVPGKIRRRYMGALEIVSNGTSLEAIVTMQLETAVASIVAAESPPLATIEALKAQAIAARSFLIARQTEHQTATSAFDFCDTTHCQLLRSPPAPGGLAEQATRATAGMVLTFEDATTAQDYTLPAMYARSCGGRTRTLKEIGVSTTGGYPYYAVRCRYCASRPEQWRRTSGPIPGTEADRLKWNRVHGWGAVPSLTGKGMGHGVGLCQLGAADMARHGATFAQILEHYYPNTRLTHSSLH